jgi:hypothetical protein
MSREQRSMTAMLISSSHLVVFLRSPGLQYYRSTLSATRCAITPIPVHAWTLDYKYFYEPLKTSN